MAIRFDATDTAARTANVPNIRNFSACGWTYVVTDSGAAPQAVLSMLDGTLQDGIVLYWDNTFQQLSLTIADAGAVLDAQVIVDPSPVTGTWFAWFVKCGGNGTNAVEAGIRAAGTETWTTGTADMNASVADNASFYVCSAAGVGQYLDCRMQGVKAWDAVLTNSELLQETRAYSLGVTASVNFWWPWAVHTDTADYSGNGRNPTITGTLGTEAGPDLYWGSGSKRTLIGVG